MLLNPIAGQGGGKPRSYYVLSNQNIIVAAPLVGALFVNLEIAKDWFSVLQLFCCVAGQGGDKPCGYGVVLLCGSYL